ncbi:phosphatase PAP2 family protein [Sorangium sp. So ce260]|uniref:phosphatase PAP2 family protein n=1 Tax=Sorangium sp. So ce260 TaxID=3133291 RepID=UPI003F6312B6
MSRAGRFLSSSTRTPGPHRERSRRARPAILLAAALSAAVATSSIGRAQAPSAGGPAPGRAPAAERGGSPSGAPFGYHGRGFELWDYIGTGLTLAAFYTIELGSDGPTRAHWTGPVPLIDRPVRDLMHDRTRAQREQSDRWSDYFWYASVAYPALDAVAAPLVRGSPRAALQMTLVNIEAFALTSLLVRIPHKLLGRSRPLTLGCEQSADYSEQCATNGRFVSFPGGHLAVSMTGAGLACAHHLHNDLYGSPLGDALACGATVTTAALTGYFRLRADKHWLSDQLVSLAIGFGAGYALPVWIHYRPFWESAPRSTNQRSGAADPGRARWGIVPLMTPDVLGGLLLIRS